MMWPEDPDVLGWRGLDLTSLNVDQAFLNVTSLSDQLYLYSLSADCHRCPYSLVGVVRQQRVFTVDTKHPTSWRLYSRADGIISTNDTRLMECEVTSENSVTGQFGVYDLIHRNASCDFITSVSPVNVLNSLIIVLGVLLSIAILAAAISVRKIWKENGMVNDSKIAKRSRVRSLDTFRGLTLVLMVFVNDGAGGYWFLEHATWNGLLMADVLFPWFMWIMGVCIPISVRSQLKRGVPRTTMLISALRRAVALFLFGLMLNTVAWGPDLGSLRIFGVLQRFGVVYLIVSAVAIAFTHRPCPDRQKSPTHMLSDVTCLIPQWVLVIIVLALHTYLTLYVPVPGCPLGYMDAGGIQDMGQYSNCTGGMSRYVDQLLLGDSHMFPVSTVSAVYHTPPFDPEGVLGCLPSVVQVFLGVQAGSTLLTYHSCHQRVTRWLLWGVLCAAVAAALVHTTHIPVNKNLWTLPFVFVTSSLAFLVFSLCYLLVDHFVFWNGSPFIYPGMNSIFVYMGHMVCYQMFPWHWRLHQMNTHLLLTVEAVWSTALWLLITYWLYIKQCFITV